MQKIEKWRIEELSLALDYIVLLLRLGEQPEWASVFSHFDEESRELTLAASFNLNPLRNLVRNIKNCYSSSCSFSSLSLGPRNLDESSDLNREFILTRARLRSLLEELERRMVEYVN